MKGFLYILLVCIGVSSCKKDNSAPVNMGYHYFPTTQGAFVVYDVVSIVHDDMVSVHDTNSYQIKASIGETDTDLEGDLYQKLYRYKRSDEAQDWEMKDVWTMKLTDKTAEVVEENIRIIKMAFGISYAKNWDCNSLNFLNEENCSYMKITEPFKVNNGNIIDSTAIVEHSNNLTFIDYSRYYEVYAANIGQIYSYKKEFTITNTDTLNPIKGIEQFYSMTEYGIE